MFMAVPLGHRQLTEDRLAYSSSLLFVASSILHRTWASSTYLEFTLWSCPSLISLSESYSVIDLHRPYSHDSLLSISGS